MCFNFGKDDAAVNNAEKRCVVLKLWSDSFMNKLMLLIVKDPLLFLTSCDKTCILRNNTVLCWCDLTS